MDLNMYQKSSARVRRKGSGDMQAAGLTLLCPMCLALCGNMPDAAVRWLESPDVMNPVSRMSGDYICQSCAKAEALCHYTGLELGLVRVAVYNDRQEAIRLPALTKSQVYGSTAMPVGGYEEWVTEWARRIRVMNEWRNEVKDGYMS